MAWGTTMKTYETIIRGKWLYDGSESISDMIDNLVAQINYLTKLKDAGANLISAEDDYCFVELETTDKKLVEELGLEELKEVEEED